MTAFSGTAQEILEREDVQQWVEQATTLIDKVFKSLLAKSFRSEEMEHIYLNKYILKHAVESYYCDLHRLTIFRGISADRHKQAAFIIKWLTKLRPVQIHADVVNPSIPVMLSNEYLAVAVGLVILFRSAAVPRRIITAEKGYIQNLVYLLHFHSCISPEQLASEFYLLERRHVEL
jgi:hypothetical protein